MGDNKQLPQIVLQRKKKGQLLKQVDLENRTIESGPLGETRLILNIALDFQEQFPGLSWDDAGKMAIGYYQRVHVGR
jgi:hypothetical protein